MTRSFVWPVSMTVRFHLFPFRTQKLSSLVPKIVGWRRPVKIGRCRLLFIWPVGQAVKTAASHAVNMGSIPVRVTRQKHLLRCGRCFFYCIAYKDAQGVGDPYGNRTARAARPSSRAATTPLRGVAGCIWQIKSAGKFAEKQRIQGARP